MGKLIINREELNLNNNINIKLISYEGGESPYRILSNKNEFIVLDNNNFGALHGKINNDGNLSVTYMDTSLEITILGSGILIENSKE